MRRNCLHPSRTRKTNACNNMAKIKTIPNKKPKQKKEAAHVTDKLSKTAVTAHNLSITSAPTHKPVTRLTDSITEYKALDFVFGFNFPDDIHTTGKHTHSDFQKTFEPDK